MNAKIQIFLKTLSLTFLIVFLVIFLSSGYSSCAQNYSGTYTNIIYNDESGDVTGIEIKIIQSTNETRVFIRFSDGGKGQTIQVKATVKGQKITFSIPDNYDYASIFVGKIEGNVLRGKFKYKTGAEENVSLKKGKSYWEEETDRETDRGQPLTMDK